jgi:hypothetical protein
LLLGELDRAKTSACTWPTASLFGRRGALEVGVGGWYRLGSGIAVGSDKSLPSNAAWRLGTAVGIVGKIVTHRAIKS